MSCSGNYPGLSRNINIVKLPRHFSFDLSVVSEKMQKVEM
jgi:hypothetical protein